jgi:hypothetical protein
MTPHMLVDKHLHVLDRPHTGIGQDVTVKIRCLRDDAKKGAQLK